MKMLGFVRFVFSFFTSVARPEENSAYTFKVVSVLPGGSDDLFFLVVKFQTVGIAVHGSVFQIII